MLVIVSYDVNTETAAGRKRLRQLSKQCVNYGQRVQNSVFECILNAEELVRVKHLLIGLIDPEQDSLRFYVLGNKYRTKTEHYGVKPSLDLEGTLIL